MNRIEKKAHIKAVLLLIIVFILLYVSCFYFPKKIEVSSVEIIDKKKKIEQLNIQNNQIENIRDKHNKLQKDVSNISEYIIDYSNISSFVAEIKNVAEKNNIELNISVSNEEKKEITKFLSYINYNIKATGKFNNMMSFLNHLENLKYYIDVEKIEISRKNKEAIGETDIVLNSRLKVYVRDNK